MLQYDFENSIGYWVFAAAHEFSCALNEELAAHGITLRQWEVLALLSLAGEQSQSELAERLHIEAPTLVGVLDRMQRDGWIQRVPDAEDRRRNLIRPTQQVEPVWNKMIECAKHVRGRATQGIRGDEMETLRALLGRVRENLAHDARKSQRVAASGTTAADASLNGRT